MTVIQAVILSLMVHALLILSLIVSSSSFFKPKSEPKLFVEFRQDPQKPMAAETSHRVEKQTRTREVTPTEISALQQPQSHNNMSSQSRTSADQLGQKLRSLSPSEDDVFIRQSPTMSSGLRQRLQSFLPPELEIGDMVALNTDQDIYYSFYRRMAEKVVWPWAQQVVNSFERMQARHELGSTRQSWVTIIEVLLDKNGAVIAVEPLQLAGQSDMDEAPVRAFRSAKNFPNPPHEMVDEDGTIHIRYRFTVHYNPQSR